MAKELSQSVGHPDEAAAAARLIYASDPPYYDFWFGSATAALHCLEIFWREPAGSYGHQAFGVWRDKQRLVALANHYPAAQAATFALTDTQAQAKLHGDLAQLQQRDAMLAWLFPHVPDDVWYLRTLAVDANYRGQQIGQLVLTSIAAAARAHGATELHTDVDSGNSGAVRFYQRQQFEIVTETRVPMLEPFNLPASYRMICKLA